MSGGFFRGATADQDTRFSNKQAKLLKSQKFAPELEHLVDVSKVKMDVIKPWIAKRKLTEKRFKFNLRVVWLVSYDLRSSSKDDKRHDILDRFLTVCLLAEMNKGQKSAT